MTKLLACCASSGGTALARAWRRARRHGARSRPSPRPVRLAQGAARLIEHARTVGTATGATIAAAAAAARSGGGGGGRAAPGARRRAGAQLAARRARSCCASLRSARRVGLRAGVGGGRNPRFRLRGVVCGECLARLALQARNQVQHRLLHALVLGVERARRLEVEARVVLPGFDERAAAHGRLAARCRRSRPARPVALRLRGLLGRCGGRLGRRAGRDDGGGRRGSAGGGRDARGGAMARAAGSAGRREAAGMAGTSALVAAGRAIAVGVLPSGCAAGGATTGETGPGFAQASHTSGSGERALRALRARRRCAAHRRQGGRAGGALIIEARRVVRLAAPGGLDE